VGQAAKQLGLGNTVMYKKVQQMLSLGLLVVQQSRPRAGKAIKDYQAVAKRFFIPFCEYPPERILSANQTLYAEAFAHAVQRLYREQYFVQLDWGACTAIAPNGDCFLEIVTGQGQPWDYLASAAPAVAVGWNPL
jgi:hypothetical protein